MNREDAVERIKQRDNQAKKRGFNTWMSNPMTKALISTIPSTENSDIFKALLQACFEAGYMEGCGATSSMFMEAMLTPRKI